MRLTQITVIVFFGTLLFGCTSPKNEKTEDENSDKDSSIALKIDSKMQAEGNEEKALPNNIFLKSSKISNGNYTLKIDSYYSKAEADTTNILLKDVVLKQEISFLFNDSLLKKMDYPVKKLTVKTSVGTKVKMQENNIYQISIVSGAKDWFYKISGGGVLDTQSEFYGAYSPNGDLLWYSYATYRNVNGKYKEDPNEDYGDLDKTLIKYKVSEDLFNKPEKKVSIGSFK